MKYLAQKQDVQSGATNHEFCCEILYKKEQLVYVEAQKRTLGQTLISRVFCPKCN